MNRLTEQLRFVLRAHLAGSAAQIPEAGIPLWLAFLHLSAARSVTMAGPNAIRFSEIEAYARLMRMPLAPHHVEVILALDAEWLNHAYAKAKAPEGVKTLPPLSKTPLSAGMLDAMFG